MFELPGAKRVCREDIKTPPSSRSLSPSSTIPDSYAVDALRHIYSSLDTFTAPEDTPDAKPDRNPADEDAEQEFEFRLFRSPAKHTASDSRDNAAVATDRGEQEPGEKIIDNRSSGGAQKLKIRLRSPSPGAQSGEGGFVVPFRGWGYYLSDPDKVLRMLKHDETGESHGPRELGQRESYLDVAMTGEEVMTLAKSSKWPGCHLPWRIIHLQTTNKPLPKDSQLSRSSSTSAITPHQSEKKKKTKPGKKRRIVRRQRLASKKAEEEADRDKRTRRNREKKLKRRQREREKKAATKDAAGCADPGERQGEEEESCQESS